MKIVVTGTRGIPDILGGVETHCQELYPRIAAMGHDVTLFRRTPYLTEAQKTDSYKGVRLRDVYAPRRKSLEAFTHTLLCVLKARRMNPDILHIHAIGPSMLTPLARLLGMRVVVTHHGPDYERGKWGKLAKTVLRLSEKLGARYASSVIVISKGIQNLLKQKYGRTDTSLIFNGVPAPTLTQATDFLAQHYLHPKKYVLALGRFVPEKNFHQLLQAWAATPLASRGYRLVIAGDADHEDAYSRALKKQAEETPGAVLTGFVKGAPLHQLLSHAALFTLPSSHEGLPISLLEAMSYSLDVIVSDIAPNRLDQLLPEDFFPVGDTQALASTLEKKLTKDPTPRTYDLSPYNWDTIAHQTVSLYADLL